MCCIALEAWTFSHFVCSVPFFSPLGKKSFFGPPERNPRAFFPKRCFLIWPLLLGCAMNQNEYKPRWLRASDCFVDTNLFFLPSTTKKQTNRRSGRTTTFSGTSRSTETWTASASTPRTCGYQTCSCTTGKEEGDKEEKEKVSCLGKVDAQLWQHQLWQGQVWQGQFLARSVTARSVLALVMATSAMASSLY